MSSPIITPIGMLSFPVLFTAKPPVPGSEPRFSLIVLFDEAAQKSPEYAALKKAVFEAGAAEWGEQKMRDPAFLKKLRLPFRDASEKDYEGFDAGKVFIAPWTKQKPGVVDGRLQEITAPDDVWAGQLVRCDVKPFTYSTSGNTGISLALNHVQVTKKDMPRIDGRRAANKAFGAVDDGSGAAGTDDDVPF